MSITQYIAKKLPFDVYTANAENIKLRVNIREKKGIGKHLFFNHTYEPGTVAVLRSIIRRGMICADVGANIGFISLVMARMGATVHAFEPSTGNYEFLKTNTLSDHNVFLHNYAVSDKNDVAVFYEDATNMGGHSLRKEAIFSPVKGHYEVMARKLDDVLSGPVDLIKSDTQGNEARVIRGAAGIISRWHPMLLLEFWPFGLKKFGDDPGEFLSLLRGYGYDIGMVDEDARTVIRMSDQELIGHPDCDYGLVPGDKMGSINILCRADRHV